MKKKCLKQIIFAIILIVTNTACHKEPVAPVNEQELITTLKLTLTDTAAPSSVYTIMFQDLDGEGGADGIYTPDSLVLPAGKVFNANLLLLDERDELAIDTTNNEIEEESAVHQFFYESIPTDIISNFNYLSFDDNGKPLGTEFKCKAKAAASNGTLRITLRHEPSKSADGVADGDITNADGETDIEVEFPVRLY